jgi:hypothetical protein
MTSIVSSSSCRCSVDMSGLYATMSASSPGSVMLRGGDRGLRRDRAPVGDVLLDLRLDGAHERLDLQAVGRFVGELLDGRAEVGIGLGEAVQAEARLTLDDRPDGAVLQLDDLGDLGQRADA